MYPHRSDACIAPGERRADVFTESTLLYNLLRSGNEGGGLVPLCSFLLFIVLLPATSSLLSALEQVYQNDYVPSSCSWYTAVPISGTCVSSIRLSSVSSSRALLSGLWRHGQHALLSFPEEGPDYSAAHCARGHR